MNKVAIDEMDDELYAKTKLSALEAECSLLRKIAFINHAQEVDFLLSQKAELVSALKVIASAPSAHEMSNADIARSALDRLDTVKD